MITHRQIDREEVNLTLEAEGIAAEGSHEAKVFDAVRQAMDSLKIADLPLRRLNCMPARLDDHERVGHAASSTLRELWVSKVPRWARAKRSKQDRSKRTKTPLEPQYVHTPTFHPDFGSSTPPDRPNSRHKSRAVADNPADPNASRTQSPYRAAETQVDHHAKGHQFRDQEGAELRCRTGQGGDRFDSRHDSVARRNQHTTVFGSLLICCEKGVKLKLYNFKAMGAPTLSGALHPRILYMVPIQILR